MLTTRKLMTGEFAVDWNGIDTGYRILNGSRGLLGRDTPNMYGFVKPDGTHKWIGTLAACKKLLAYSFQKRAA
jgi:hypothetical protein